MKRSWNVWRQVVQRRNGPPHPTRPDSLLSWSCLTAYFSESIWNTEVKCWHIFHSSLQFVFSKLGINNFYSLEVTRILATLQFFCNFQQFFYHNFRLKGKFKLYWFHQNDLFQINQNQPHFEFKKIFFIHEN